MLVLFAICCAFAPKARARKTFVIGGLTALITAVCQRILWSFLESKLGPAATFYGIPAIVACVFVCAFSYYQRRGVAAGTTSDQVIGLPD
jgi:hypothetical protein